MDKGKVFVFLAFLWGCSLFAQEEYALQPSPPNTGELAHAGLETVGMDARFVHQQVDSIINTAIQQKAFPGAQVLVAKEGKIIFHKAYGHHTYDSLQPVALDDLYDLASVTKIMAPLPAIMKLVDEGKIGLDQPFSTYWKPWQRRKDKRAITVREILAHQAGLQPYIVFLNEVVKKNGSLKKRFVKHSPHTKFTAQAFENIYIKNRFKRKIYRISNRSKVAPEKKYVYSGLTFLIFPEIIERLTGEPYEDYLKNNFYLPVGANTMVFNPRLKNLPNKIVPTEMDTLFRKTLTQNWVHDENASLLGGVSGNAGLFSTATDLAKMMQMYMQLGTYGGRRFLSEATVKEFIKVQYPENENRRGLGFDKPNLNNKSLSLAEAYPAPEVGHQSFGHSGFTGTFVWADPESQMVYIFLSNRVHPSRNHGNIYKLNVRSAVQQVFYLATQPSTAH